MSDFTLNGTVVKANLEDQLEMVTGQTRSVAGTATITGKSGYTAEFELRLPRVSSPEFDPLEEIALTQGITIDITIGGTP